MVNFDDNVGNYTFRNWTMESLMSTLADQLDIFGVDSYACSLIENYNKSTTNKDYVLLALQQAQIFAQRLLEQGADDADDLLTIAEECEFRFLKVFNLNR